MSKRQLTLTGRLPETVRKKVFANPKNAYEKFMNAFFEHHRSVVNETSTHVQIESVAVKEYQERWKLTRKTKEGEKAFDLRITELLDAAKHAQRRERFAPFIESKLESISEQVQPVVTDPPPPLAPAVEQGTWLFQSVNLLILLVVVLLPHVSTATDLPKNALAQQSAFKKKEELTDLLLKNKLSLDLSQSVEDRRVFEKIEKDILASIKETDTRLKKLKDSSIRQQRARDKKRDAEAAGLPVVIREKPGRPSVLI